MNVFDSIMGYKPARKLDTKPVSDKLIGVLLYMASRSQSAGNSQEWHFVVVDDPKQKELLSHAALKLAIVKEAPVVIVVCADLARISNRYGTRGEIVYAVQDTAVAVNNILISATALGLSADWIRTFDEEEVKASLELPDSLRPLSIIPVGYPLEKSRDLPSEDFERLVSVNRYSQKYELTLVTKQGMESEMIIKPMGKYVEDILKDLKEDVMEKSEKRKRKFRDFVRKLKK